MYSFILLLTFHCIIVGLLLIFSIGSHVHGGAIATILDAAIGNCIFYCGYGTVTANLSVDYRR